MPPEQIDELIEKNIKGGEASLKMYDGITHLRMHNLAKRKKWMNEYNIGTILNLKMLLHQ